MIAQAQAVAIIMLRLNLGAVYSRRTSVQYIQFCAEVLASEPICDSLSSVGRRLSGCALCFTRRLRRQPYFQQFSGGWKSPRQFAWRTAADFGSQCSALCGGDYWIWVQRDGSVVVGGDYGREWSVLDYRGLYVSVVNEPVVYRCYGWQSGACAGYE